ncbi:MAG: hypothetical protein OXG53_16915 [Chloroflexi bacterium]|nr:hypothetical protein [Chloroflexota bacterium]
MNLLQRSSRFALVIGICVAASGFAFDLLPSARPGLNSVQLLVILTGFSIALLAFALPLLQRRKAWRSLRSTLARALIVAVLTLLALELVLVGIGYQTYFPQDVPAEFLRPAPWWTCEDPACHYVQDEMATACEIGSMSGRYCIVNAQGFHDSQDFVYRPALENQTRILALGDSFTFGEAADIGKSYVETLEAGGSRRVVWNTGIFGVGTNQALAAFEMFAPVLKPHLTIYGFYVNDFFDNLFPVDGYFLGIDENGDLVTLQKYHLDPWGNVTKLETQSLLYYRWRGVEAPANEFERLLGSTRLGSVFISAIDQLGKQLGIAQITHFGRQVDLTRGYLRALRDASAARDSELLIMLIPKRTDLREPGAEFRQAVNLFEELGISYIMPIEILDAASDYAPDWHWNNAGHQKVGVLLSDCVDRFVSRGNLNDCRHVVLP